MVRPVVISLLAFSNEFAKIAAEKSTTRTVGTVTGAVGGAYLTHKQLKGIKNPKLRAALAAGGGLVGGLGGREVGEAAHAAGQGAKAIAGTGRAAAHNMRYALD